MGIRYLELGTFASLSVQLKNYQAEKKLFDKRVLFLLLFISETTTAPALQKAANFQMSGF